MSYRLFVDDTRFPTEVAKYFEPKNLRTEYYDHWIIVRNYKDFTNYILQKGLPTHLSLDHDLGKLKERELFQNGMSKKQARLEKKDELNGMDCLKWLIEYLLDNNLEMPVCFVHSQNPVGKENIESLIQSFQKQKMK